MHSQMGALPGHIRGTSRCLPVDLAAMTDPDDVDQEHSVEDLVDDPVVADANPVDAVLALQCDAIRWPWVTGQDIQCCPDALLLATQAQRHLPDCSPRAESLLRFLAQTGIQQGRCC